MTTERFRDLICSAAIKGKLVKREKVFLPFGCDDAENELYEIEGYHVMLQDHKFLWMEEIATGKTIKEEDTTKYDIAGMTNTELDRLIKDAQKVMRQREIEDANKAIDNFMKAWQALKPFAEIRIKVSATGEKHFHTTIERLDLEVIPLK